MSLFAIDSSEFISEVQKHPVLWDPGHEDYKNMAKKQAAWYEIAEMFVDGFNDMPAHKKNNESRKVNNKWRNLRDSYVRTIKKKNNQRTYIYYKQLSFLAQIYESKNDELEGDLWSDSDERSVSKKRSRSEIDPSDEYDSYANGTSQDASKFVDLNFETTYNEPVCNYPSPTPVAMAVSEDADRAFFESVLPIVREFDMDTKLEFRSEVLGLIKKIRLARRNVKLEIH